jgi:hypothetical protein
MRNLLLSLAFFLTTASFAQVNSNQVTIIPTTSPSTGAPSSTGTVVMRDLATPPNTITQRAPASISSSYQIVWPNSISSGCFDSDSSGNLSIIPACTGAMPTFLMAHSRDDNQGLWLAYSSDAVNWNDIDRNGSMQGSTTYNALRDPGVVFSGGVYYFAATPITGCQVQFWNSSDLVHFSAITTINLATPIAGCTASWGPRFFTDPATGNQYFWIAVSFDPSAGAVGAFTTYLVPINLAANTIGTPVAITLNGTTTGRTFDQFGYYDGAQYYLWYVDETPGYNPSTGYVWQPIAYATSTTLTGTYTQQSAQETDYLGFGVGLTPASACVSGVCTGFQTEAPSAVDLGNGCTIIYVDTWIYQPIAQGAGGRAYSMKEKESCLSQANVTAASNASAAVLTVSTSGVNAGDSVKVAGYTGTWSAANGTWIASAASGSSITIPVNSSTFGAATGTPVLSYGLFKQSSLVPSVSSAPVPLGISAAEHGQIIPINTSQAGTVLLAALAERGDGFAAGRQGINTPTPLYTLDIRSRYAPPGSITYNEAASVGIGYLDGNSAILSACGITPDTCPTPWPSADKFNISLSDFGGMGTFQIGNVNTNAGEASIMYGDGITTFGNFPLSVSPDFFKAIWSVGENNQSFTGTPHWFGFYNEGVDEKSFVTGETLTTLGTTFTGCLGMKITVGASPVTVYGLGRWVVAGNGGNHYMYLLNSSGTIVASYYLGITTVGALPGHFVYTPVTTTGVAGAPSYTMSAGQVYYVMSSEIAANVGTQADAWYNGNTAVTGTGPFTVTGSAYLASPSCSGSTPSIGVAGSYAYGPVDVITSDFVNIGGTLFALSPYTGEARATFGLTLGVGAGSKYAQTDAASLDAFGSTIGTTSTYRLNIGHGVLGSADLPVYLGELHVGASGDSGSCAGCVDVYGAVGAGSVLTRTAFYVNTDASMDDAGGNRLNIGDGTSGTANEPVYIGELHVGPSDTGSLAGGIDVYNQVIAGSLNARSNIYANGTAGASATVTVRNSAGTGTCTITYSMGLAISSTC